MNAMTEVPFRLAGGEQPLIIIPAHVNGRGPFAFVLDTGAGHSGLSAGLAERLGVRALEYRQAAGAGGRIDLAIGRVASLALGPVPRPDVPVIITGEFDRIGAVVGTTIDGNIGHNYLGDFRVTVDYARRVVRLAAGVDTSGVARADLPLRLAAPAKPLILVPTRVNGHGPFPFVLDTGASTTVIASGLARRLGLPVKPAPSLTGGGGRIEAGTATVAALAVGDARRERLAVMVADFLGRLSEVVGTTLEGVLGYNFNRDYRVTIDYPGGRLRLE